MSVKVLVGGGEVSAQAFKQATDPFEKLSDINILYEGSDNFEAEIVQRVQAGNLPVVAFFPQPGLLSSMLIGTIDLNEWFSTTF